MTSIKILILGLFISCFTKDVQAQDQTLDSKQQRIVIISAFTAKGDLLQLQKALNDGLDAGLTVNEIKEVLVQLYAYAGFPRSLNALNTFMTVLKERKGKSVNDPLGKAPSPLPTLRPLRPGVSVMQQRCNGDRRRSGASKPPLPQGDHSAAPHPHRRGPP